MLVPAVLGMWIKMIRGSIRKRHLLRGALGRDLVPVIGGTGLYQLGYATLLTLGLVLSA